MSARVADDYRDVSDKTLLRDLNDLLDLGLVAREPGGYRARRESILQFLPSRKASEDDALQMDLPLESP